MISDLPYGQGWVSVSKEGAGSVDFLQGTFQLNTSHLNAIPGTESVVSPMLYYCSDATRRAAHGKSKLCLGSKFGLAESPARESTEPCSTKVTR